MPRLPPRPRSHSYTGPNTAKPTTVAIPPFHPINSVISDEHRAAHNLRVLQRHDPAIRIIHDQIPYVHIRLMKPPGTAAVNPAPGHGPGDEEFWEDEVDGPEGPLFFVEREADSLDDKLGFCVLNTKDIFSWFQILHRDDEIEFSPEMAIIVPSSRKDVMWPAIRSGACDGIYSAYVTRLLARCHLLLKYGLEWPDRWKGGHGKLPEQYVADPQSASHEPFNEKPLHEKDLLTMLMIGSKITEIERVAEEIVRVVQYGGTWCRNEYMAPDTGWPADWEEPKGTSMDVWGAVAPNQTPRPGETTTARATLIDSSTTTSIPTLHATPTPMPIPTPEVAVVKSTPKKKEASIQSKKKGQQAPNGRILNNDVLSNLLAAPLKNPADSTQSIDEHKTPVPADFITTLPDVPKSQPQPVLNGKGRRAKGKGKKAPADNSTALPAAESDAPPVEDSVQVGQRDTSVSPVRWRTPSFGIIDDRLSDDDEGDTTEYSAQSSPRSTKAIPKKASNDKSINDQNIEQVQQALTMPTFVKYHQKGYIPKNTEETPAINPSIMHDVLLSAVEKEGSTFPQLERNDWIRELLQLIHTNKKFVDSIYGDYKSRLESSSSAH